ncbi:MAG: sugar ABC transporter ATP-binding protein [delta proteobacterium ML8_F1]|nr:MAG: sugar ABC transporter ATP-binding protein [delta proteobacterium ML8_F1]
MVEPQEVTRGQRVLELHHITKLYSGTVALDNVELAVERGEVHGIIGKNGAGKSTLVGIISGIIPPSRGEIIINGKPVHSLTPAVAKKHSISIITQEPQVIEESTVTENLFMPKYLGSRDFINWRFLDQKAKEILDRVGFPVETYLKIRDLSISEKQLLLVIKACYVEEADIIIMDEVSASLNQKDQRILYRIIDERIKAGKTVIFISHHTKELLEVCDRVSVIRDGHSVGCYDTAALDMKSLASLIVGETHYDELVLEDKSREIGEETIFELRDFTAYGRFEDINLKLRKGEIVGIAGLRGSGRTELFKAIAGIDTHEKGELYLHGVEKSYNSPEKASADGVMYLAEERENEGLVNIASIKKNLTINILSKVSRREVIYDRLENPKADELIKTMNIKAFSREQEINQLSGGNKQKVLVGKILAKAPRVCLLDEATRGVDIEAKESILNTINEEMRKTSCILISSPGVDDLIKICDRIMVLYKGRIIDEFARPEFNEEKIYRVMQGELLKSGEVK